jgi:Uma2 family endonuclease
MGVPKIETGPMTVDEFYSFTDRRPDGEKWELIDGELILNAAPSDFHQLILKNLIVALGIEERRSASSWRAIPGIGALVSSTSRPEPDVMILPRGLTRADRARRDTADAVVLFEIMSPSTASRDLKWKRDAYTQMTALTHYVVVAQDDVDVVVFARDDGFAERRFNSPNDVIVFPALGISLPLSEIYRDIDFA